MQWSDLDPKNPVLCRFLSNLTISVPFLPNWFKLKLIWQFHPLLKLTFHKLQLPALSFPFPLMSLSPMQLCSGSRSPWRNCRKSCCPWWLQLETPSGLSHSVASPHLTSATPEPSLSETNTKYIEQKHTRAFEQPHNCPTVVCLNSRKLNKYYIADPFCVFGRDSVNAFCNPPSHQQPHFLVHPTISASPSQP